MDSNHKHTTSLLLTGATGQLGAAVLLELLGHGATPAFEGAILCVRRASSSLEQLRWTAQLYEVPSEKLLSDPRLYWLELDLLDALGAEWQLQDFCSTHGLPMPKSTIHAAALIDLQTSREPNRNARLAEEMVALAAALRMDHLTHVSSIAVMGGNTPLGQEGVLGPEDFHPNRGERALGRYAKSKIASELAVWRAEEEGLSVSIIRPGVILGVGPARREAQELWRRLYRGKLPIATDGTTGVVDVRDVAEAVCAAHGKKARGPFVLVGANPTFEELLRKMSHALGRESKRKVLYTEPWLERMRALSFLRGLPVVGRFFTAEMRTMLFSKVAYDGASGKALLGREYRDLDATVVQAGAVMKLACAKA